MSQRKDQVELPKYSTKEKTLFKKLVLQERWIIANKKTDGPCLERKAKAWEKITTTFNSSPFCQPRTTKQLIKLWYDIKTEYKAMITKQKYAALHTGGGVVESTFVEEPDMEAIMDTLDVELRFAFDSDTDLEDYYVLDVAVDNMDEEERAILDEVELDNSTGNNSSSISNPVPDERSACPSPSPSICSTFKRRRGANKKQQAYENVCEKKQQFMLEEHYLHMEYMRKKMESANAIAIEKKKAFQEKAAAATAKKEAAIAQKDLAKARQKYYETLLKNSGGHAAPLPVEASNSQSTVTIMQPTSRNNVNFRNADSVSALHTKAESAAGGPCDKKNVLCKRTAYLKAGSSGTSTSSDNAVAGNSRHNNENAVIEVVLLVFSGLSCNEHLVYCKLNETLLDFKKKNFPTEFNRIRVRFMGTLFHDSRSLKDYGFYNECYVSVTDERPLLSQLFCPFTSNNEQTITPEWSYWSLSILLCFITVAILLIFFTFIGIFY